MITSSLKSGLPRAALLLALLGARAGAAAASPGIHVALTTANLVVAPNSDFEVDLEVTQPGDAFNAYNVAVSWIPLAVTLQPTSPASLQEGALMTGVCGNTFMDFHPSADSATVTHSLLCSGATLQGPGQLYRLHFHAGPIPQVTVIRFQRQAKFYKAGVQQFPVVSQDLVIAIGSVAGVEGNAAMRPLAVRAEANPFRGSTWIRVEAPEGASQSLEVHDAAGRRVRSLGGALGGPGTRRVAWDGRDARGTDLPSGAYWLVLRADARQAVERITLVR